MWGFSSSKNNIHYLAIFILTCVPMFNFHVSTVPPKIFLDKKYDETIYLYAGQSTAFEVPFTGNPQPIVTWTFNEGDLPDKIRMETETIYNMTTIRMSHVKRTDTGSYTVTLSNDNGKAVISIKLVVLGKLFVGPKFL